MTNEKFTSVRLIDGKPKNVIVDKDGKIINSNPSKEALKGLKKEPYKVNRKGYNDDELLEFMKLFYKEESIMNYYMSGGFPENLYLETI